MKPLALEVLHLVLEHARWVHLQRQQIYVSQREVERAHGLRLLSLSADVFMRCYREVVSARASDEPGTEPPPVRDSKLH